MSDTQEAETDEAVVESERGRIVWHSSEECGGPDVGISLGLGDGRTLWCGEITKSRHEEAGEEAAKLGNDVGWWIILFEPQLSTVIGKCVNQYVARDMLDTLAMVMRKKPGSTNGT